MIVNISKAKKFIGKEFELKSSFALPSEIMLDFHVQPMGDVALAGTYFMQDSETCIVNLKATIFLNAECARCADLFTFKYEFDVCERFVSSPSEDEYKLDNTTFNLYDAVVQNFLTSFPSQLFCNQNCKGLCQYCGNNLNYNNCNCEEEQTMNNSPFAILKQLKK